MNFNIEVPVQKTVNDYDLETIFDTISNGALNYWVSDMGIIENNEIKVRPSESDVYVNNLLKGKVIGFLVENDTTVEIYELNLHKLCVGLKIFLSNNIEYITDDAAYSNNVCVDHIIQYSLGGKQGLFL